MMPDECTCEWTWFYDGWTVTYKNPRCPIHRSYA